MTHPTDKPVSAAADERRLFDAWWEREGQHRNPFDMRGAFSGGMRSVRVEATDALRGLLDAIHAGRLVVPLNPVSAGYVKSVVRAGECALAAMSKEG